MCGIAGTIGYARTDSIRAVQRMCNHMLPRGPDDEGIEWFHDTVAFGGRRLAIIDPSPAGRQPMVDPGRETALVYNGMLYNFRSLRRELESRGERFASQCDTEVVLRAYGVWGPDFVTRLRGMFALAIWDGRSRELLLARDRLGIKPLYFVRRNGRLAFASQVKTLVAGGLVTPSLSTEGVRSYLAFGAVSEPGTILAGVEAFPAGHVGLLKGASFAVTRYWDPPLEREMQVSSGVVEDLLNRLATSVTEHLVSDAPIGVFLSGGLDSSLLAALAAKGSDDVRTISIDFAEPGGLSERSFMDAVARHIGSTHTSVVLKPADVLAWLPKAFKAMDQPSFDGLNTYAVSRAAAATGLKVAVSGIGADELFDGYGFVRRIRALERLRRIPSPIAKGLIKLSTRDATRADKLVHWAETGRPGMSYELMRSLFLPAQVDALMNGAPYTRGACETRFSAERDMYRELSYFELANYTRNVLLRDTDAMSMANSLEVRVPYLDDEIVSFALALPADVKGEHKKILLAAASGLIPSEIVRRRKHGFLMPYDRWLQAELEDEVRAALDEPPSALAALIDASRLPAVWESYHSRRSSWLRPWALFSLSRWIDDAGSLVPSTPTMTTH